MRTLVAWGQARVAAAWLLSSAGYLTGRARQTGLAAGMQVRITWPDVKRAHHSTQALDGACSMLHHHAPRKAAERGRQAS